MSFDSVLREAFPGSLEEGAFVQAAAAALAPLGFDGESALACVATCRDEVSQTLPAHFAAHWGPGFNLAGLAGMIFAGKTGFGAALAHGPMVGGRERYVFFAGPHVGIGPGGEPGVCERQGRTEPSSACGALLALLAQLRDGPLGISDDPDDVEQELIRRRLGRRAAGPASEDLFALTELAHDIIAEDLEHLLASTIQPQRVDWAVATGIQIHGPGRINYIQPRSFHATIDGQRQTIALTPETPA